MNSTSRKKKLATFCVVVVALAGGTAVSTSDSAWSATASALADPMSVLAGRSPGARSAGALAQTKPARVAMLDRPTGSPVVPSERVLPLERVRPALPVIDGLAPPVGFGGAPLLAGGGLAGMPGGGLGGDNLPGGGVVPGGGGAPGGGGGGGLVPIGGGDVPADGGGGGGGGGAILVPGGGGPAAPPVGNVPEPATWAMLIGGMLAIGGALRRRQSRVSSVAACAPSPR